MSYRPKNLQECLGDVIAARRTHLGLTGLDLARSVGCPRQEISRIENGKMDFRLSRLESLAKALDIDICWLVQDAQLMLESYEKPKKARNATSDNETSI